MKLRYNFQSLYLSIIFWYGKYMTSFTLLIDITSNFYILIITCIKLFSNKRGNNHLDLLTSIPTTVIEFKEN